IAAIEAGGGTAMSKGLLSADGQFSTEPAAVRLALMLTDGANKEGHKDLPAALERVKGRFQCHSRGIGEGWTPAELLLISNALLGEAKALAGGSDIGADMQATFAKAMSQGAGDIKLRLTVPPKMAKLVSLRQVSPVIVDLTPQGVPVDDRTTDYPTGAWGDEERDYHAVFELLQAGGVGEQVRVCRTAIVNGHDVQDQPPVAIGWSADASLTARICAQVAHYTGQAELAEATREGLEALDRGDARTATIKLGQAAKLAADSNNDEATRRLAKIVDIVDQDAGTVRIRAGVAKLDLLDAEVGATRTVRVKKPA
ncbi:MAG: hypothetical protein JO255_12735, partial [Alphaproteobacteria bacterium]|nr:hypothetical protein [Alphaproteobacteria bacterium]